MKKNEPIFIAHRINTIKELGALPRQYGVEIDIRQWGKELILQHEPFMNGEKFEDYLKNYRHAFMILNIKCERVEHKVLELIKKYKVKRYFFLDSSFPMIHFLSKQGEKNIALRYSEFEGLDTVLAMKGKVKWVWVDCFTRFPINHATYKKIKNAGYKLCLVSPELVKRDKDIEDYGKLLRSNNIFFDAICTKHHNIERWKRALA
jgi:hypothetical protein